MREISPVLAGEGSESDATHAGWGVVLDTIEIQDVTVLSPTVFSNMQAPYRQDQERKAREASEDAERSDDVGYVNADKYKVDKDTNPEDLPSLSDLRGAFGAMFG